MADGMWRGLWDVVFAAASLLAPILLGAVLGNLVRGVPVSEDGWFTLSLFESFSPNGTLGILDWYTTLAGVFALVAIGHHGALFLVWKTEGAVHDRSRRWAAGLFPAVLVLWVVATIATARVNPDLFASPKAGVGRSGLAIGWEAQGGVQETANR